MFGKGEEVSTIDLPVIYKKPNYGHVVAAIMYSHDIEYMYKDLERMPGICPVCHSTISKIPNLEYRIKMQRDIGNTYDGFTIVNEKFKRFCQDQNINDVDFIPLPSSSGYYYFNSLKEFKINKEQTTIQYLGKHYCCGEPEWAGKYHIVSAEMLPKSANFICHFPLFTGDCYRKKKTLIVGLETARQMKAYGIRGMSFHREIYYNSNVNLAFNELREKVESWLNQLFVKYPVPETVTVFHFGIYDSRNGYNIYIHGCSEYDEQFDDWCNTDVYSPKDCEISISDISIKNLLYENFQKDIVSIVRQYISSNVSPLSNKIVAVGFDDGELTRIQ